MLEVPGEGMEKQEVEMHEHRHDQAIQRLRKIAGHVNAVVRMIEEGRDCPEVLLQISAVRAAISQVGRLVLEDHLDTCIVDAISEGSGEKALADLKQSLARFIG